MKYSLQEHDKNPFAGSKAKEDVIKILAKEGYKPLFLDNQWSTNDKCPFLNSLGGFYIQKKLWLTIRLGCEIVIQWPFYHYFEDSYIIRLISRENVKSILIVHDINCLRNPLDSNEKDIMMCNVVSKIIVHSEAMKMYLINYGVEERKISILRSFDYLTNEETPVREYSNKVVFAGNLKKSPFLNMWDKTCRDCRVICYGSIPDIKYTSIEYKGKFNPENITAVEGSWGLVWDGSSIDVCDGEFGRYLMYNSPHKFSLYTVAGLPIIIWSKSALASYVVEKKIGVVVNSLKEIDEVINNTTEDTYNLYRDNIIKEANDLKLGNHLKSVL